MAMTPEGRVKAVTKNLLNSIGAWWFMVVSNGMGRVGCPDFITCIPYTIKPEDVGRTVGLFAGIETKSPGKVGNTTPNQDRELAAIRDARGLAVVVDSAEMLREFLEKEM